MTGVQTCALPISGSERTCHPGVLDADRPISRAEHSDEGHNANEDAEDE